jgi:hypothetical protein
MIWKAVCDRCGSVRMNSELRKEWTGYMVCADTCWEARNAQERVRGVADRQAPPWVRPEPADVFLPTIFLRLENADGGGGFLLLEDPGFTYDPHSIDPRPALALEG